MEQNYFLSYRDEDFNYNYSWFETEEDLKDFIDNSSIVVQECFKIIHAEDLTEKYKSK